jgi:hypothetical protein
VLDAAGEHVLDRPALVQGPERPAVPVGIHGETAGRLQEQAACPAGT